VVELAALFRQLKETTGSGFLVISHSPGVLARIADTVLVMRAGRIVEHGPPRRVFGAPADPYTASLLAAAEGPIWNRLNGAARYANPDSFKDPARG